MEVFNTKMETKYMTISEIEAIPFISKTVIIHNDDNTSNFIYFDSLGRATSPSAWTKNCHRTDTRVKRTEKLHGYPMVEECEQEFTTIHYDADGNFLYGNYVRLHESGIAVACSKIKLTVKLN